MWKFLLDPVVQGVAFLFAASALALVAWDLYEEAREPSPRPISGRPRKKEAPAPRAAPRRRVAPEPSVEIWTDAAGETRGRVRRGPCRGQRLEEMGRDECEAQTAYARDHDPQTVVALELYIRRRFPKPRAFEPAPESALTRALALAELGLDEGASAADIHAAYRALIKTHHPDRGGSTAKAARLNQAKDLLVG